MNQNLSKKAVSILLAITLLIGMALIYNVVNPPVYMSDLTKGYWTGYYETNLFGKVWCLAKFYEQENQAKMLLLTVADTKDIYAVKSNSSDEDFVHYVFKASDYEAEIRAKQLYWGKRYIWQRLLAGRLNDFWKPNDEDQIRGHFISSPEKLKFEIERMSKDKVVDFYNHYVLREINYSDISEIDSLIINAISSN